MTDKTSGWMTINSVTNGYTIEVNRYVGKEFSASEKYIARSWAEVIDLMKDIDAPDYAPDEGEVE